MKPEILQAVKKLNFEETTPIQEKIIPFLLSSSKDLIALAQTGTGKTAAFGLPILEQTDLNSKKIQTLILSPTRELTMQITRDIESFSVNLKNFKVISVYGGANIVTQMDALRRGGQIVVGTPGRALDLIRRKRLDISKIRWLVLDEADEMLSMGFKDDLDTILAETPKEKQTLLFSATMPKGIVNIANKSMDNPEEISAGKKNIGAENVDHYFYMVQAKDRYEALKRITDINPNIYGIVFCRTRRETKEVAEKLMNDGYNADALHGDLSQAQRDYVMNRFRVKHLQILVATDVAARGIDVKDLTHIINYNLPDENEIYIHRTGRTGRAGKKGIAITIIHSREMNRIRVIEKKVGKKFIKKSVPGGKEICKKQLFNLIDRVEKVEVNESEIEQFIHEIEKKIDWLSREDLIKHFVSVEFNRFLSYYEGAHDLNVKPRKERDSRERRDSRDGRERRDSRDGRERRDSRDSRERRDSKGGRERRDSRDGRDSRDSRDGREGRDSREGRGGGFDFTRFYINIGKNKNLNPASLMKIINDNSKFQNVEIGSIDILKNFSFFEFDKNHEKELVKAFKNVDFEGTKLIIEPTKKDKTATKFRSRKRSSDYPSHAKFNSRPDQKRRNKKY
jgi:ATP-dependent RNA helicase DeaD